LKRYQNHGSVMCYVDAENSLVLIFIFPFS